MLVNCVRKDCIADPNNEYHQEPHLCFACGAQWYPTEELLKTNLCPDCNWLKCPVCGGCKCSLSPAAVAWVNHVRSTYCQSVEKLAFYREADLPSPRATGKEAELLVDGLGLQLMFCIRWARVELDK